MRSILNKIIFISMITSFAWVVVGDLVNMHLKVIYKKDLYSHNVFYTKSNKLEKKSKILNKSLSQDFDFIFPNSLKLNLLTPLIVSNKTICVEQIVLANKNIYKLRGPPTLV